MRFNYAKICQDLIRGLPQRQKEVVVRRFGLAGQKDERETLEAIGESFGITRERVRQVERDAFSCIKPRAEKYRPIFASFQKYFQTFGNLRKEDKLLNDLGEGKWQNQAYFLLSLDNKFSRVGENRDFWPAWIDSPLTLARARSVISDISQKLDKIGKPVKIEELVAKVPSAALNSYLEISKKIQKNSDNFWGLKNWPEINPRGVRDKALLVFKKEQKPLHFTDVAGMIKGSLVQTVHNELIRDPRFILVGRGMYALKDWGYEPGQVKDVISKTLKENGKPLSKEEILDKVLKQRLVKENTVFLNLGNRKYFSRDSQGKYWIREA